MISILVEYTGSLRTQATHGPSSARLITDAPIDNHGLGEAFSPTDLLATSLATCMATVMGIAAAKHGLDLNGMRLHVDKHMSQSPPRRIARLDVRVEVPEVCAQTVSHAQRVELERAADSCPVRLSLSDAMTVNVSYAWGHSVSSKEPC